MDFSVPSEVMEEVARFSSYLKDSLAPRLSRCYLEKRLPADFFAELGRAEVYGFTFSGGRLLKRPALREALLTEELARVSPGAAIAALAHADLGLAALYLFGSERLKGLYGEGGARGDTVMCLGNTEGRAGSDVAAVAARAERAAGGWKLDGAKAYVTNGALADLLVVTAVTDPDAPRSGRLSMFLVDLNATGIRRVPLNKQVWVPSDLTRIELRDVFVPEDHLLGAPGRGLQQVLTVFTFSRIPIAALALGTAAGAFDLAVKQALTRTVFGRRIADHQAKSFELAELHAEMEAARLALFKACWQMDRGGEFRADSSIAKYLAVAAAKKTCTWAADIFGAASVIFEHPIHKYPMDAWAAALGEGTQDVQKLIIFRELMKRYA